MPKPIRGNQDWLKPTTSQPALSQIAKWDRVISESNKILLGSGGRGEDVEKSANGYVKLSQGLMEFGEKCTGYSKSRETLIF